MYHCAVPQHSSELVLVACGQVVSLSFSSCSGLLAGSLDGSVFWQSTSDGAFEHHSLDSIPGYP